MSKREYKLRTLLKSPDLDDLEFERGLGVWSVWFEDSFQKHLKRLYEYTQGKRDFEPRWYG